MTRTKEVSTKLDILMTSLTSIPLVSISPHDHPRIYEAATYSEPWPARGLAQAPNPYTKMPYPTMGVVRRSELEIWVLVEGDITFILRAEGL
jgi:hypothetical protein